MANTKKSIHDINRQANRIGQQIMRRWGGVDALKSNPELKATYLRSNDARKMARVTLAARNYTNAIKNQKEQKEAYKYFMSTPNLNSRNYSKLIDRRFDRVNQAGEIKYDRSIYARSRVTGQDINNLLNAARGLTNG